MSKYIEQVINEARKDNVVEDPAKVYQEKLELFAYQQSWTNLLTRWKDASREYKENMIMMLLMHNYPFGAGTFVPKMGSVNPRTGKNYLPWGKKWVEGINHTFGTLLTEDDFRANFRAYQESDPCRGITKDKNFIKMMKTNGHRGSRARQYNGVITIVKSFADMYKMLTNPMNAEIYGKNITPKSISGKRGRPPVQDGRYIEFNMRDMPVIMVRGRFPFSDKDKNMNDCYALVGMERPESKTDKTAVSKWLTLLKGVFSDNMRMNDYDMIYQEISPCSLEYWMADIERRKFADTDLLGRPTTRKRMFKPTSRLQLRENGMFRFYTEETMDDEQGWNPDPMLDKELVDSMPDEYHVNSRKLNITENMSRFDEKWQRKMDALYEAESENILSPEKKAAVAQITKDIARRFYDDGYYLTPWNIDDIRKDIERYFTKYNYTLDYVVNYFRDSRNISSRELMHKEYFEDRDKGNLGGFGRLKDKDSKAVTEFEKYLGIEWKTATPEMEKEAKRVIHEVRIELYNKGWYVEGSLIIEWRKQLVEEFVKYANKKGGYPIDYYKDPRNISKLVASKLEHYVGFGADYGYSTHGNFYELRKLSPEEREEYKKSLKTYESAYSKRRGHILFEGKALTPEEKMDRWHEGTRKENIKVCALEKLKEYRKICRAKGYTEEVKQINAEINRRKKEGINESYLYEGVLSSYTEFSEPSKDQINDTITMLKKCRSNLDSVMYNFDRDLPDDVYTEMRQVYGHICSAMDLLPDYF